MSVHLKDIEILAAGPLRNRSLSFTPYTLIYAPNESGKTTLVENLSSILFGKGRQSPVPLRKDFLGHTSVTVRHGDGEHRLTDKGDTLFDLIAPLELHQNISELLVVRASDPSFGRAGVMPDMDFLVDRILPSRDIDAVLKVLPPEISYTTVEDGKIIPRRKTGPEYKRYIDLMDSVKRLSELRAAYEKARLDTLLPDLEKKARFLKEGLRQQRAAKAWHLESLRKERKTHAQMKRALEDERIHELQRRAARCDRLEEELRSFDSLAQDRQDLSDKLQWLKAADNRIESLDRLRGFRWHAWLLVLVPLLLVLSMAAYFLFPEALLWLIVAAMSVAFLFSILYYTSEQTLQREYARDEKDAITLRCRGMFGISSCDGPERDRLIMELQERIREREVYRQKQYEITQELKNEKAWFTLQFEELRPFYSAKGDRHADIAGLRSLQRATDEAIARIDAEINFLERDESMEAPEAGLQWDSRVEADLIKKLADTGDEIHQRRSTIAMARAALCRECRIDDSESMKNSDIIALAEKEIAARQEAAKGQYAKIVSAISIYQQAEEWKSRRSERMEEVLNSPRFASLLLRITGRYSRFILDEENVLVDDGTHQFPLSHLSSGSLEQVSMALRMAMAEYVLQREEACMILDDAFLFSDEEHRKNLVDSTMKMVDEGWQVIYCTMDRRTSDIIKEQSRVLQKSHFSEIML